MWITKEAWDAVRKENTGLSQYRGRDCYIGCDDINAPSGLMTVCFLFPPVNRETAATLFVDGYAADTAYDDISRTVNSLGIGIFGIRYNLKDPGVLHDCKNAKPMETADKNFPSSESICDSFRLAVGAKRVFHGHDPHQAEPELPDCVTMVEAYFAGNYLFLKSGNPIMRSGALSVFLAWGQVMDKLYARGFSPPASDLSAPHFHYYRISMKNGAEINARSENSFGKLLSHAFSTASNIHHIAGLYVRFDFINPLKAIQKYPNVWINLQEISHVVELPEEARV